jgi:hypothetical protein
MFMTALNGPEVAQNNILPNIVDGYWALHCTQEVVPMALNEPSAAQMICSRRSRMSLELSSRGAADSVEWAACVPKRSADGMEWASHFPKRCCQLL